MHLALPRRFGLALWVLWFVGATLLLSYQWSTQTVGVFVYRTPPGGATFDVMRNEVVLPDGRAIPLKQQLSQLQPWQVDWNQEPEAAPVLVLNWKRLLRLGLFLPVVLWLLVEAAVWLVRVLRRERAA